MTLAQTGAVIALDAATGDEVWRFAAEADAPCSVPTLVNGNAFVECLQGYQLCAGCSHWRGDLERVLSDGESR